MKKIIGNNEEIATLELINKHFWKSKIGPICALSLPFFLMIIYRILGKEDLVLFKSGLTAYFSFSILPLCFISLPQMIIEFKTSIILRKISISKITSLRFSLLILSYNIIAIIASTIIIVLIYATFLNVDAPVAFAEINWGFLIYALFNTYISCLSVGLLISVFVNRVNLVQAIALFLIIITITFSGQFIPVSVLARSEFLRYLTLLSPASYSLNMVGMVLTNNNKDVLDFLKELSLDPSNIVQFGIEANKVYMEEVRNYKFNGIFDLTNSYRIFTFKYYEIEKVQEGGATLLNNVDQIISQLKETPIKISSIKSIEVYRPWQLGMNLVMPYVITISFVTISIKKFKWFSR